MVPEIQLSLPIPSSEAVQVMTTTVFLERSEVNDYISGMLQRINMGLVPLCCRGPVHSIDTRIAALECTCQCLRQYIMPNIPPSDIRHWSTFGEFPSDRISHGDKTWACGRRVMWLPEHAIMSEKIPSGKKQGMSSDDTSISYLCPNLNFDGL